MPETENVRDWFVREVLPHERLLMSFLQRNWRNGDDIVDLRQEVYAKLISAARAARPTNAKAYMLAAARNLLISRTHRAGIVSFEQIIDLEQIQGHSEEASPERVMLARDELRRVRAAIGKLPPRCQEVFLLRKVEGLSLKQIAERTGLSTKTVENHLSRGIRGLADMMHGPSNDPSLETGREPGMAVLR